MPLTERTIKSNCFWKCAGFWRKETRLLILSRYRIMIFFKMAKIWLTTEVILTSVNAMSEDGIIVNIDGTDNRVPGSLRHRLYVTTRLYCLWRYLFYETITIIFRLEFWAVHKIRHTAHTANNRSAQPDTKGIPGENLGYRLRPGKQYRNVVPFFFQMLTFSGLMHLNPCWIMP